MAELASGHLGLRNHLIPALYFLDVILPEGYKAQFHEDNQAFIQVLKTGKNPTMKHVNRTFGISIQNLHTLLGPSKPENEQGQDDVKKLPVDVVYTPSDRMAADIHTKGFPDHEKWEHACRLINVVKTDSVRERVLDHRQFFSR